MKELDIQYIASLVLSARQNNSDAFASLYAMTYDKVYNYARHYLRDDYIAQDALQEIYILALKNLEKLKDPTLFIAWLNRITFNVCCDFIKKIKGAVPPDTNPELLESIMDENPSFNPETYYQQEDEHSRLRKAVDDLPFREKQVIIMRFYNNMKLEDIASACGISRSSVKRYLASGQAALKQKMKG